MTAYSVWPDARQNILLHAALDDDQSAINAFRKWCGMVDLSGDIDGGSYRLLPLVYANLSRLGCEDALMGRLRGIYRHSWCDAQLHLRRGAEVVNFLEQRAIPTLVSKGLPLAVLYYPSPALRPMSDIDLVVPRARARDAVAALEQGGWEVVGKRWRTQAAHMVVSAYAVGLRHPKLGLIDIHWRLFSECLSNSTNERIWKRAEPFMLSGSNALCPSAEDMLLHVTVHGLRPNPMPPLRWVTDAAMILRRDGANIDWDYMMGFAREAQVAHRFATALTHLHREFGLVLPSDVVARSARSKPGLVERLEVHVPAGEDVPALTLRELWLGRFSLLGRFLFSDRRKDIPHLILRWLRRRLPLRQEALK